MEATAQTAHKALTVPMVAQEQLEVQEVKAQTLQVRHPVYRVVTAESVDAAAPAALVVPAVTEVLAATEDSVAQLQ